MSTIFYVYAYIRSKDSPTAKAGTPYYVGKGKKDRAYQTHKRNSGGVHVPKDKSFIIMLETNLTELGALAIERRLISWWGRKDTGTGILLNQTDGGDGAAGARHTEDTKHRMSVASKGKKKTAEHAANISSGQKGKKLSAEQIAKHRDKMTGRKLSEEHKNSIREGAIRSHIDKPRTHLVEAGIRFAAWANDNRDELIVKIKDGWASQSPARKMEISKAASERTKIQLQNESAEMKHRRSKLNSNLHKGNKWYTNGTINKRTKTPELLDSSWYPGITVHK